MKLISRSGLAAVAASLAFAGAARSQVMILTSQGPSASIYREGTVLQANASVTLKAGDRIELLDASGSHVLAGPNALRVSQIDQAAGEGLRHAFSRSQSSRNVVAATRGFDATPADQPTSLWELDVSPVDDTERTEVKNFCVVQGQSPMLWRSPASAALNLVLSATKAGSTRTVTWPSAVSDLLWPGDVVVTADEVYRVKVGEGAPLSVRLRVIPETPKNLVSLATTLADQSCFDQLDTLNDQLAGSSAAKG